MKKILLSVMVLCASVTSLFAQDAPISYNEAKTDYGYMNPIVSGVPSMSISPDAVAEDEIVVTATSAFDSTKTDTCTITIA